MLRLLVDFLSGIIRVLAIACIAGGAFAGYINAPSLEVEPWAGALIGFAAGFLAASIGAGLIACLILIENHLRILADAEVASRRTTATVTKEEPEAEPEETDIERAERIAAYTRKYRSVNYDPARDRRMLAATRSSGTDAKDDREPPTTTPN